MCEKLHVTMSVSQCLAKATAGLRADRQAYSANTHGAWTSHVHHSCVQPVPTHDRVLGVLDASLKRHHVYATPYIIEARLAYLAPVKTVFLFLTFPADGINT